MKKWILIIITGIAVIGCKVNIGSKKSVKVFHSKHSLKEPSFNLIFQGVSPNNKYKYIEYRFDNGELGYSRVFWAVIENNENVYNLEKGLIPDGYQIAGWISKNRIMLEKWNPKLNIRFCS